MLGIFKVFLEHNFVIYFLNRSFGHTGIMWKLDTFLFLYKKKVVQNEITYFPLLSCQSRKSQDENPFGSCWEQPQPKRVWRMGKTWLLSCMQKLLMKEYQQMRFDILHHLANKKESFSVLFCPTCKCYKSKWNDSLSYNIQQPQTMYMYKWSSLRIKWVF